MSFATLVRNMAAAGANAEAIALAIEAIEAAQLAAPAPRARSGSAERMARKRARDAETSHVTQDVTRCDAKSDACDGHSDALPLALPPSPQTPQPPTHTRKDSSRARKAARFDEFWSTYPSKVGKKAAVKAYAAAINDISAADPEEVIIAGLRRALPGWSSGKFIPNPATWLNQGRWDDQPVIPGAPPVAGAGSVPLAPKFNGPPALRKSVVDNTSEAFALNYIDPATWRAEDRTLIAANGFAVKQIERNLRDWLVASKVRVEVAGQAAGAAA